MTVPLAPGSTRATAARRFGEELDRAMRTRKVGAKRLGPLTGTAISAIGNWRAGLNLPRYSTAVRMADALAWPKLAEIVRVARTGACVRCGREWLNEGGTPKRFCTQACRYVDEQLRKPTAGAELAGVVRDELARRHVTVQRSETDDVLDRALAAYARSDSKRLIRRDQLGEQLTAHQAAVDAMCRGCEPEGRCRTPECPLRGVTPLPVVRLDERAVDVVTQAPGLHSPEHRERWLASVREGNARRWSRPGERERAREQQSERWRLLTPGERDALAASISAGIDPAQRSAASTAMHAARRARAEATA